MAIGPYITTKTITFMQNMFFV